MIMRVAVGIHGDNIERVRRDEEEARQREAVEEGRMMLAVRPLHHICACPRHPR